MKKVLYPSRIERNNLGDILINALLIRELLKEKQVYFKGMPSEILFNLIAKNNPNIHNLKIIKEIDINGGFLKAKIQTFLYLCKNPYFSIVFDTPGHISATKRSVLKVLPKVVFEIY